MMQDTSRRSLRADLRRHRCRRLYLVCDGVLSANSGACAIALKFNRRLHSTGKLISEWSNGMARTLVISFRSVRPTDCYNLESHKYVKNIIPARRNLPFGAATISPPKGTHRTPPRRSARELASSRPGPKPHPLGGRGCPRWLPSGAPAGCTPPNKKAFESHTRIESERKDTRRAGVGVT